MCKPGLSDFKAKREGDEVYCTEMAHAGRRGTVIAGTPDDRPVGVILVRWDDGSVTRISSTKVTAELEEWE